MLKPDKLKGRGTTIVLALVFLIVSVIFFIREYQQMAEEVASSAEKTSSTPFFKLLLESSKPTNKEKPSFEGDRRDVDYKEREALMIRTIQIYPQFPTVSDNIKAVATSNYDDQKVSFEYKWYINNVPVEGIKEDTLPKGMFRKNDLISVSVTPYIDGKKGYTFISTPIIVQNSPPSIDIKDVLQNTKLAQINEIQLIGSDPDGDQLTYVLEPPIPDGMTINPETGKILWKSPKKEKGLIRFKASVSDPDGGKVVKVFEIDIK
ncbi:MAG: Ig domain-containing protein [Thermodesulfovibrionales bacterium]|nr:Ig domain-containing protein [Thermodesulfovibrionales bacterium]